MTEYLSRNALKYDNLIFVVQAEAAPTVSRLLPLWGLDSSESLDVTVLRRIGLCLVCN